MHQSFVFCVTLKASLNLSLKCVQCRSPSSGGCTDKIVSKTHHTSKNTPEGKTRLGVCLELLAQRRYKTSDSCNLWNLSMWNFNSKKLPSFYHHYIINPFISLKFFLTSKLRCFYLLFYSQGCPHYTD